LCPVCTKEVKGERETAREKEREWMGVSEGETVRQTDREREREREKEREREREHASALPVPPRPSLALPLSIGGLTGCPLAGCGHEIQYRHRDWCHPPACRVWVFQEPFPILIGKLG
jgi:hypothetical protein